MRTLGQADEDVRRDNRATGASAFPSVPRKLYISGPMTGIAEFNYPAFHAARDALRDAGFAPISPADLPLREDWDWIDYMMVNIDSVFECDGVATLSGCDESKGSRIECRIAQQRGVLVLPLEEWLAA